jgi:hypothetical protein
MLIKSSTVRNSLLAITGALFGLSGFGQVSDVLAQSTVAEKKASHSATDLKQSNADNVAQNLSFKPSSSILISTKPNSNIVENALKSEKIAQSSPTSNSPFTKIQRITTKKPTYLPGLNSGTPTGFGLETGDAFVGIFGATAGRLRDTVDGSLSVGTGLGDASKYFAVEGVFNINSIRNFGANGSFDLKVHKLVYEDSSNRLGIAAGWTNFANYGTNASLTNSAVYGVATLSTLTNPASKSDPKPLVLSAGVGGGVYRKSDTNGGVGVFGSVGYLLDPQWGVSTGWSGQGLNFAVGYLPDPAVPLNINLTYSDVTNNSNAGTQLILGITYGFNYLGRR